MVGEHAVRLRRLVGLAVAHAALGGDPLHDLLVGVGVEERVDVLEEHRAALEAEARVDVLLRQRRERPVVGEVVLHEDEVPVLEEAVAVAAGRAVGPLAAVLDAAVEVELRARPARAGVGGLPEVLGARQPDDPLARDADAEPAVDRDLVLAEAELRVAREDGRPDRLRLEARAASVENSQARSIAPSLK